MDDRWTAVDTYFSILSPEDDAVRAARAASLAAELPEIQVSASQGALLRLLVRTQGARRVLEIGTLGGYSTLWLAGGLEPGGHVTTLELDPRHADVARASFARAGLSDVIDLRVGPAAESLARLVDEGTEPFDFVFIDADKPSNPVYLEWSLRLARVGTVIFLDNAVRGGAVADPGRDDERVHGVRRFTEMVAADPRLSATAVQTVGEKGYDGFVLLRVDSR